MYLTRSEGKDRSCDVLSTDGDGREVAEKEAMTVIEEIGSYRRRLR